MQPRNPTSREKRRNKSWKKKDQPAAAPSASQPHNSRSPALWTPFFSAKHEWQSCCYRLGLSENYSYAVTVIEPTSLSQRLRYFHIKSNTINSKDQLNTLTTHKDVAQESIEQREKEEQKLEEEGSASSSAISLLASQLQVSNLVNSSIFLRNTNGKVAVTGQDLVKITVMLKEL